MNGQNHTHEPVAGDDGSELDPREAAALLDQTTRGARRRLDPHPPLLMFGASLVILVAYGTVWLSVRNQHPYNGPTPTALAVLYSTIAAWATFVVVIRKRATSGISGRSEMRRRREGIAFAIVWAMVYVFQGALHHAGASHAIVYGIYPASAPLVIVGGAAATYEAARENWEWAGFACAAVVLGAVAAYTGPASVWGVIGIGAAVLLFARAGTRTWLHR